MGGGGSKGNREESVTFSPPDNNYDPQQSGDEDSKKRQLWKPRPKDWLLTSGKIYIAKHEFKGVNKHNADGMRLDLPFKENEQVLVRQKVQGKGGWWLAQIKKKSGYVPSEFLEEPQRYLSGDCYFPDSSFSQLAQCLTDCEDGQYLIKDIKDDSGKTFDRLGLAVRTDTGVHYYMINIEFQLDQGKRLKEWFYIDERHCFDSLSKLLKHYSENPGLAVKLSDTPTFLKPNNKKNKNKNKYSNNSWELPRDKIILDKEPLGAGHFGQVHRGVWTETDKKGNSEKLEVAVKTLIEATNDPDAFTKEAEILTKVKHRNLVRMIGVCAHEKPPLIVTEFCNGGSLIGFLRDSDGQKCSMKKLVKMIGQVATGMSYLETVKIVHRDLAARNVLLTDDRKCKVCDFGLARFLMDNEIYQGSSKSKFPWKWTAPEGLSEQRFSSKSDVWSFGVLCFEMTSRGQGPYKGLERKKIQQMLQNGYRLEQPQECPLWVYLMMRKCWKLDPHERYSFRHIRKIVHKYRNHQEQDNQKIKSTTQLK